MSLGDASGPRSRFQHRPKMKIKDRLERLHIPAMLNKLYQNGSDIIVISIAMSKASSDIEDAKAIVGECVAYMMVTRGDSIDPQTYMRFYTAIYNICMTGKPSSVKQCMKFECHPLGKQLYLWLDEYLQQHLQDVCVELSRQPQKDIVRLYAEQCKRYTDASRYNANLFRVLERFFIRRERMEGRKDTKDIDSLHTDLWRQIVEDKHSPMLQEEIAKEQARKKAATAKAQETTE